MTYRSDRFEARGLTPEQRQLAERLMERAFKIQEEAEDGLSVQEAVRLAAVQLGLEPPERTDDHA
jgi:hypothetical protein